MKRVLFVVFFICDFVFAENFDSSDSAKHSCDATAKILVKCMMSENCAKAVEDLRLALLKVEVMSEIEKDRMVSYCLTECRKGDFLRKKGKNVFETALVNEYHAIYSKCLQVFPGNE